MVDVKVSALMGNITKLLAPTLLVLIVLLYAQPVSVEILFRVTHVFRVNTCLEQDASVVVQVNCVHSKILLLINVRHVQLVVILVQAPLLVPYVTQLLIYKPILK
jgi:hypothetical protein